MQFGKRGKTGRSAFDRAFDAVREALAAGRMEAALARLREMEQAALFPVERRYEQETLIGQILYWLADMKGALPHLRRAWELPRPDPAARLAAYSDYLMYLHYVSAVSDAQMRAEHLAYGALCGAVPQLTHKARRRTQEKLRIGYLSPNLTDHIVLNFAVQLFSAYDRTRFAVYLYDAGGQHSEVTDWVAGMADGYADLSGDSPQAAAQRIHADAIDILFDMAGHSAGGTTLQIAAYKPAPVQISGIGYFDTTGLCAMDYVLGDPVCDPPSADALFTERILRLPETHLCFTPSERFRAYESLCRTPHDPVVFGSFNNFAKITDEMLALWAEILHCVPRARLLLKNVHPYPETVERMRRRAAGAGMDPARLEVRPGTRDYLRDYLDVDIILDTHPYPGGGTTCEALCMGLPVVTMAGTRHGARFGASLLHNAGLSELVTDTPEAYAACAVGIASDPQLLTALHTAIPQMMRASPLMDAHRYVRAMEAAYEMIWERYCDEEA